MDKPLDLPSDIDDWTKEHVRLWVTKSLNIEQHEADILYKENVTGLVLRILSREDFLNMKITYGSTALIIHKWNQICKEKKLSLANLDRKGSDIIKDGDNKLPKNKDDAEIRTDGTKSTEVEDPSTVMIGATRIAGSKVTCTPYPFDSIHERKRYTQHHFLLSEAGTSNYIDPVHEYKEFTKTEKATEEDKKMKFCNEVFRFAAACMNDRINGTIHFGIRDKPHGEIIGVHIVDRETYSKYFYQMMDKYFEDKQVLLAKQCIRPPRYVQVLSQENTQSDLVVIEVDVAPKYIHCNTEIFKTYQYTPMDNGWMKSKELCCFVRDGESSKDILANSKHKDADFIKFSTQMKDRDDARQKAEDNHKSKQILKMEQGHKLVRLITGNSDTLDNSYFKWYILVTNKSQESHTEHLQFLHEIPWFAVLDFDPESNIHGLCKFFREKRVANLHFPHQYQNMGSTTSGKLEEYKLSQQTSWIFCNGRSDLDSQEYKPLSNKLWHKEKAADVRRMISFFCRKDVMQPGKVLIVFLLLSTLDDQEDPMKEVFCTFYQELTGMTDILCICESEQTFQRWRDLQATFVAKEEMEKKCIYKLDIEDVNETILNLKSSTRSSGRLLPSHFGSSTILESKDEGLMTYLSILCANECCDTEIEKNEAKFNEFMKDQEKHFYKGGRVTWWNFYFSSEKYTGPFIKRDSYEALRRLVEDCQYEMKNSVQIITLHHHPGCGGTTTAMHVLWDLRNKFRCATLKRETDNFTDVAKEIIRLATHESSTNRDYFPVLLLVDVYKDVESVFSLQNCIRSAIAGTSIRYARPVVIILHCMRSQNPMRTSKVNVTKSITLMNRLSDQEKRDFEEKFKEIEQRHESPEDFYSFMIMKSSFNDEYIETVARNMLKGLNNASKEAQLISFLALLNKYVNDSNISVSMCEEFLGITVKKAVWGRKKIEDKLGPYSALIFRTKVEEYGGYEGVRMIHPLIAKQCIEELKATYDMQQSSITLDFLKTSIFYDTRIGRDLLSKNVQSMLLTRQRKEHGHEMDTLFSPLIEEINKDEGHESVVNVLMEGTIQFNQNPFIFQALARHFYIRKRDTETALKWANKAKEMAPNNSFISDTLGQIYKIQLKNMMQKQKQKDKRLLSAPDLRNLLEKAEQASQAFKDCQLLTEKAWSERVEQEPKKSKGDDNYNIAGYLGQIEVCFCTIDVLLLLPWFKTEDPILKKYLVQYMSEKSDSLEKICKSHQEICDVLQVFRHFLTKLKSCLKENFNFLDDYFVCFKQKISSKESFELKVQLKIDEYHKKYTALFCEVKRSKDGTIVLNKSMPLLIQDYRLCLEYYKADRFSGILQYLKGQEKDVESMEFIVTAYRFLLEKSTDMCNHRDKQNFILANIVLHCISAKSTSVASIETLKEYLREVLEAIGLGHKSSDPYFLASLLFWPQKEDQMDSDSKLISKYINSMKKSSREQYRHMHHAKYPIAHFYLTSNKGLKRFLHKARIDQSFSNVPDLKSLWQRGEIWKNAQTKELLARVQGRVEDDDIIVEYGSDERVRIPVRPDYLGKLRSGKNIEQVSFYLGFSIDGPIAYGIEMV